MCIHMYIIYMSCVFLWIMYNIACLRFTIISKLHLYYPLLTCTILRRYLGSSQSWLDTHLTVSFLFVLLVTACPVVLSCRGSK